MKAGSKLSYEEAKTWAKLQNIRTKRDWFALADDRPENLPGNPANYYKDEWEGWSEFLGKEKHARKKQQKASFDDAALFAKQHGIRSSKEWMAFSPLPPNMPRCPDRVYEDWAERGGWKGFLSLEFSYSAARRISRELSLFTKHEFFQFVSGENSLPDNFPKLPHKVFGKDFSWEDFLGHCAYEVDDIKRAVNALIMNEELLDLIYLEDGFAEVVIRVKNTDSELAVLIEEKVGLRADNQLRFLEILKEHVSLRKGPVITRLKKEVAELKVMNVKLSDENELLKQKIKESF